MCAYGLMTTATNKQWALKLGRWINVFFMFQDGRISNKGTVGIGFGS